MNVKPSLPPVMAIFAHPDDETVLAGGIIALLSQQGIPVHVVCATRGEGGERGEPPLASQAELGMVREGELRCAVRALGASLTVMDYVDPVIGPDDVLSPFQADFDTLARQFAALIRSHGAGIVLTHGSDGEYGHPAHQLVHRAVLHGVRHMLPGVTVYTVAALVPDIPDRLWNESDPAHYVLDIRPWSAQKIAAMECHRTQHALFKRRRKLETVADALRSVESVRRAWPESPAPDAPPPDDAFGRFLRSAGAWRP